MPRGKKRKQPTSTQPTVVNSVGDSGPAAGTSDYRHFLSRYIVGAGSGSEKAKKALAPPAVRNWQDVAQNDSGEIQNEIARKFNRTNTLGISKASYGAAGPGSSSYYYMSSNNKPTLTLRPFDNLKDGPNPRVVGHELVHANDHQSALQDDHLIPLVWGNLYNLIGQGGANGNPMADFAELNSSLGKIQDKIDTDGVFKAEYPLIPRKQNPNPQVPGPVGIEEHMNEANVANGANAAPYTVPANANGTINWPKLFNDIHGVVTNIPAGSSTPNRGFYLNQVSEYPAFMSESLTKRWRANEGLNPLSHPEARFVHSTLGNMERSYDAVNHPIMNDYIRQRRNSLENAYYPNGIPAGQVFSRGGRVTGKNLLSRFKKTH